jgi:hypothetical protein
MPIIPSTPKLRCFGLVQNYAVLGLSKTTSFWAKRRNFANFRIFFFNEKKKEIKNLKKKKKGEIRGWLEPPLAQKMGWPDHPIFWPRGGRPPHTGRMGVAEATPCLWGWSGHPERQKKKKKKKRKKWVWDFGGGRTTPKGLGVASATPYDR